MLLPGMTRGDDKQEVALAEAAGAEPITLDEAVRLAVERDPGLKAKADLPYRAAAGALGATAPFDPVAAASAGWTSRKQPADNGLLSGRRTASRSTASGVVSIATLLGTGARVEAKWNSARTDSNMRFALLNPSYDTSLSVALAQPLAKDAGAMAARSAFVVARSQAWEAQAAFEAELSRFVAEVVGDYWRAERAAAYVEVSALAVAMARSLENDAAARAAEGVVPQVAVVEARAESAAREAQRLQVEGDLDVARIRLSYRIDPAAAFAWAASFVPADQHAVVDVKIDRRASVETAMRGRAEIRGAALAVAIADGELRAADDARRPDLALVGHYGLLGLAGRSRGAVTPQGEPVESPFVGDYGDALADMIGGNYRDAQVGLDLQAPVANAEALAGFVRSTSRHRQRLLELENAVSGVVLDVERALADLGSARRRVDAARVTHELAEDNLLHERERYTVGMATTLDVLDFQRRLSDAMAAEIAAITDHALALTALRWAEGTLLASFGIEVSAPQAPTLPWWAAPWTWTDEAPALTRPVATK